MTTFLKYLKNLAVAAWDWIYLNLRQADVMANAVAMGDPKETVSSRLGKDRHTDKLADFWARIVNALFFWQKSHVDEAEDPTVGKDRIL